MRLVVAPARRAGRAEDAGEKGGDRAARTSMGIIRGLFEDYHPRDFAVRLRDGTCWDAEPGQPARFTLVLRRPGALRKMLLPPNELSFGESYIYDDYDVEGDTESIVRLGDWVSERRGGPLKRALLARRLLSLPDREGGREGRQAARQKGRLHSRCRDRRAVSYHYDTSNGFFSLFLDHRMVYACAYFERPDEDLATAQLRKLDYVCRKLPLRPGERLLDIGCGWGALLIHAAREYGVEAVGRHAEPRAGGAGDGAHLGRRAGGPGARRAARLPGRRRGARLRQAGECGDVRAGGRGQAARVLPKGVETPEAGRRVPQPRNLQQPRHSLTPTSRFILRYVFPDGRLEPINVTLRAAEEMGFEVRDLESLREHYILTLRSWVRRLEECHEEARRLTDEVTYRVWRLYMSASANGFRAGRYNLHQTLLVKPQDGASNLPLQRADWYA